jgi:hypothetical protein
MTIRKRRTNSVVKILLTVEILRIKEHKNPNLDRIKMKKTIKPENIQIIAGVRIL